MKLLCMLISVIIPFACWAQEDGRPPDSIVYIYSDIFEDFNKPVFFTVVDSIMGAYLRNPAGASIYTKSDRSTKLPVRIDDRGSVKRFDLFKRNKSDSLYLTLAAVEDNFIENGIHYFYRFSTYVYVDTFDFARDKEDISLKNEELTLVSAYFRDWDNYSFDYRFFSGKVDSLVRISVVDKEYYDSFKNRQVEHFIRETSSYKKEGDTLRLALANKKDTVIANSDYYGYIPFFNSYLIGTAGHEVYDYELINKCNGKILLNSSAGFPRISPNKKYLICLQENPYELEADLAVYRLNEQGFDDYSYSINFMGWMPAGFLEDEYLLWVNDTTFVLKATHPYRFFDYWDNPAKPDPRVIEYIKVELLDKGID